MGMGFSPPTWILVKSCCKWEVIDDVVDAFRHPIYVVVDKHYSHIHTPTVSHIQLRKSVRNLNIPSIKL